MSANDEVVPYRLPRKEKQKRIVMHIAVNCNRDTFRINNGVIQDLASTYDYSIRGIRHLWKVHREMALNRNRPFQIMRKKGSGRKWRITVEELKEKVKSVPFHKRKKVRSLAKAINIPKSTLHRCLRLGVLQRSTSTIKPILNDANKEARVAWVKSKVGEDGRFVDMMDEIHIDEKWFYITQERESYIIVEGEPLPQRQCKSKRYITKVMFLAAFARPRPHPVTGEMWDGKIGIWPFIIKEPAQRASKNRPRGTMITKPINVNKEVSRRYYKGQLTPAILERKEYFSTEPRNQQDNATPHPKPDDKEMNDHYDEVKTIHGVNIRLVNQPANSPDMNVLDLAFFRAIQSLQQEFVCKGIDELIACVEKAFYDLPLETCEKVWVTLQMVLNEVLIQGGNNGYRLPHMGKDKIMKEMGTKIPYRLPCPAINPATAHQSLNGTFVKAWMQQVEAAQLIVALADQLPLQEPANPVVPQLPPIDITEGDVGEVGEVVVEQQSPTGVSDNDAAAEFQVAAEEGAEQLDVDELANNIMDITVDDDDDDDDDDEGEPSDDGAVAKDVTRIATLLKTFWANMDMSSWDNAHEEFDAAAIEGAADLPEEEEVEEEPTMDGRLLDKNRHGQNLMAERQRAAPATPTFTGYLV